MSLRATFPRWLKWLKKLVLAREGRRLPSNPHRSRRRQLYLETLEDRVVPTTFTQANVLPGVVIGLYDTGVTSGPSNLSLASSQGNVAKDPHYVLSVTSDTTGTGVAQGQQAVVLDNSLSNGQTGGVYIGPADQGNLSNGIYEYTTTFDLTNYNPAGAVLNGKWTADDNGIDILLNGHSTGNTTNLNGFQPFVIVNSATTPFVEGINTLTFVVQNTGSGNPAPNPTSLDVVNLALSDLDILVNGAGNNSSLVIQATSAKSGSYSLSSPNGGPAIAFTNINTFTYDNTGTSTLEIVNPAGTVFAPGGGIFYNAGAAPGSLLLDLGGSADSGFYTPGNGTTAGILSHPDTSKGVTQVITFTGLSPAFDSVTEPTFTVNGTNANNAINYAKGDNTTPAPDIAWGQVSVDNFEPINFTNKTSLVIDGQNGTDTVNLNNPNKPAGLTGIAVNGQNPTGPNAGGDTLIVNGSGGKDSPDISPTGPNACTVTGAGPVPITASAIGQLIYNGQGGGVKMTITTPSVPDPNLIIFTPGVTQNEGSVAVGLGGGGTLLLPFSFTNISLFSQITFARADATREDSLTVRTQNPGDQISVEGLNNAINIDNTQLDIFTPGISNLVLAATGANTLIQLVGPLAYETTTLEGSDPVTATFGNATGAVTVNMGDSVGLFSPIATTMTGYGASSNDEVILMGVAIVSLDLSTASGLTVNGNSDANAFTYQPTGANAGTFTDAGVNTTFNFANDTSTFTIDGGASGANQVTVLGLPVPTGDAIDILAAVSNTPGDTQVGESIVPTGGPPVGLQSVQLVTADTADLIVDGSTGTSDLTVFSTFAPVTIPITYNGGPDNNGLFLQSGGPFGDPDLTDSYTPGAQPGSGADILTFGAFGQNAGGTETVNFHSLTPVFDGVPGPLTVNGTNAANAINYTEGFPDLADYLAGTPNPLIGQVSVDSLEPIEFINKTTLTIDSQNGTDTVNLNNPKTPTALTAITVNGGNPTGPNAAGDTLIVNGDGKGDSVNIAPTGPNAGTVTGAGPVPITATAIGQLIYNGQGGTDSLTVTTPANGGAGNTATFTPGATANDGSVAIRLDTQTSQIFGPPTGPGPLLLPISYTNVNTGGSLDFAHSGGARLDALTIYSKDVGDAFQNFGSRLLVRAESGVPLALSLLTDGVSDLTLDAVAANTFFGFAGPLPYTTTNFDGDGTASAQLLFATGPVAVGMGFFTPTPEQSSITGYGGTVSLIGVATAELDLTGGFPLAVNGYGAPNTFTYQPAGSPGSHSGIITDAGINTTFTFTQAKSLTINGGSNSDQLFVEGTQGADTFDVNDGASGANAVNVDTFLPVQYTSIAHLEVDSLAGNDTINVQPSATTTFLVSGGDPIGVLPGDTLNLIHPAGLAYALFAGPLVDSGGMNTATLQTVSWTGIESIVNTSGPGGSPGPALIQGTNGNDEITIIARDSSYNPASPGVPNPLLDGVQDFTVSVNQGPEMLFINTPALFVDALAGNDDVVVQEPAPNGAAWNVQVYVAGGAPSAGIGHLGDTVELDTTGPQVVTYSPEPTAAAIPPVTGVTFTNPTPANRAQFNDTTETSTVTGTGFIITGFYQSSDGGVESMVYQADAGTDNLGYTTPDTGATGTALAYTPGATAGAGTITAQTNGGTALVPLTFEGLSQASAIAFRSNDTTNGGRDDTLQVNGTTSADKFVVDGSGVVGTVQLLTPANAAESVLMFTASINVLDLTGQGGQDLFNLIGPLSYVGGVNIDADATVNLSAASGSVTVNEGDNTPGSANPNTVIDGYGAPVTLIGVDTANLDATGNSVDAVGTSQNDNFVFTPTGATAGTFFDSIGSGNNLVPNTVFNIKNASGDFFVHGGSGGNADEVTLQATDARDLIEINQASGVAQVLANNVTALWPAMLGLSVPNLNVLGGSGINTFQVIPAGGVGTFPLDNLVININGGSGGQSNALVIGSSFGASPGTLSATQFVVINKISDSSGAVRVFASAVADPDINYQNIQVLAPIVSNTVAGQGLNPNLLVMGPDVYDPNFTQGTAAFLGAGATLPITNASIFPNSAEFPGVPANQDWYRVEAQTTGTLDFTVDFRAFNPALLPGGGILTAEVYDINGDLIGTSAGAFGAANSTIGSLNDGARVRIPAVAGQSYFLHVFGVNGNVVNGYNVTIIDTAPPTPFNLELSRSVMTLTLTSGGSGYVVPPTVSFTGGGGGTGASAIAVLGTGATAGQVVSVILLNSGSGYTTAPVVHFSSGTATATATIGDTGDLPASAPNDDTGRSQFDNVTNDNKPTIYIQLNDGVLLKDLPGNGTTDNPPVGVIPIPYSPSETTPGFRVAIFDGNNSQTQVGFATPVDPVNFPGLYQFTFTKALADGLHHLNAAVQMIDPAKATETGFGPFSLAPLVLTIDTVPPPVDFGPTYGVNGNGLSAASDSGVDTQPDVPTLNDGITNVTAPTIFGTAEANAIIQLYVQTTAVGAPAPYILIGQTTAVPLDGTNADPNGAWTIQSGIDMNDPTYFATKDGERHLFVVATDLAGNMTPQPGQPGAVSMNIFVDTSGPQIANVQITGSPAFNLFGLKPNDQAQGPTPLVNSLTITVTDDPNRTADFLYNAIVKDLASAPGGITVTGDQVGNVIITNVIVTNNPPVAGQPATATVQIIFGVPPLPGLQGPTDQGLPDDRYTLTINDTAIVDPAGNLLDGASNADQPQGAPTFPSGNGGAGNFVARFTVDSRPHLGIDGNGIQQLDINGNGIWDPVNAKDGTNDDKAFAFGLYTDNLFAGNFAPSGLSGNGFDKLGAYGPVNGQFRFLLATSGVTDSVLTIVPTLQINGLPLAYKFNPAINADEIAVFDGNGNWYIDYGHNNDIGGAGTIVVHDGLRGYPVVGDFDGSGHFELATYQPDTKTWQFDLTPLTNPGVTTTLNWGFPGVAARPVAADMNQDGITDIGLYQPTGLSSAMNPGDNWFFLISEGKPIVGTINTLNHPFDAAPFTNDENYNFGNGFFQPLVGIWDPPTTPSTSTTPPLASPAPTSGPSGVIGTSQPTFTWNSITGATTYEVWLTDKTTGVTVTPTVTTTSWTPDQPLNVGDNYIWWVGPVNADGSISWDSAENFTIAPTANSVSGTVVTNLPFFSWNAITGASSYEVWLTDQTTGVTVTPTVTGTSWTPSVPLNLGDKYIWWVGAFGANGKLAWSSGQNFVIAPTAGVLSGIQNNVSPAFSWSGVTGVSTYEIWLTDQTTGKTVTPLVTGTSWSPVQPLNVTDNYVWWVGAVGGNGTIAWSSGQSFSFAVTANALSGTITNVQPTFSWTGITGVTSYEVWLTDQTTGKTVTPTTSGTSWAPSLPLNLGDKYIWWVGAFGANGNIAWNNAQTFTIAPTAIAPSGIIATQLPGFSWNAVTGVTTYEVWLTDQTTGITVTPTTSGTTWAPTKALNVGDKYIWWVGAFAANGTIAWDNALSFTISL